MNEKEPRIYHTAKEFFKFLNNYEGPLTVLVNFKQKQHN